MAQVAIVHDRDLMSILDVCSFLDTSISVFEEYFKASSCMSRLDLQNGLQRLEMNETLCYHHGSGISLSILRPT